MEQVWILPAIPFVAFLVIGLFGRLIPRKGDFLAVLGMAAVVVLVGFVIGDFQSYFSGGEFLPRGEHAYAEEWLNIGDGFFLIEFSTYVDAVTAVMLPVVSFVALMVLVYSIGYMKGEQRYGWYFSALSLFVAAMLLLVISGNLLQLYLAWEGVGLASYLLIGFYWERQAAAEAAKKAFITTRIGDVGLLIGIILLWRVTGSFDIQEIIHAAEEGVFDQTYLTVAMLFLFAGAAGKSAQFPFHVWLPDAMEGPTPVSALIHAATMVVAGVYLVARMLPVYDEVLIARDVVLYTGLLTALMAATMGLVATDIKRVLAFSTVSQLGFMFVALGVGALTAAMFHLFTHAFFKSLLFLGSGSVIHATEEGRDPARPPETRAHVGVCRARGDGGSDSDLHDARRAPDLLRQAEEPAGLRPRARVAADHDGASDDSGRTRDRRRLRDLQRRRRGAWLRRRYRRGGLPPGRGRASLRVGLGVRRRSDRDCHSRHRDRLCLLVGRRETRDRRTQLGAGTTPAPGTPLLRG
jgi:NADH-quinone oxidoreductase subunit L